MPNAIIKAKFFLDNNPFKKSMDEIEDKVDKQKKKLEEQKIKVREAFSVAAVTAIGAAARAAISMGSELSDLATITGTTTDEFQALKSVAIETGASQENMRMALVNVRKAQSEAIGGSKEMQEKFKALGITMDEIDNLRTAEVLELVAQKTKDADGDVTQFSNVMRIVGEEAGPRMQEALGIIADQGLPGVIAGAKEAGHVIDAELIQKLDEAEDTLQSAEIRVKSFFATVTASAIEGIQSISEFVGALTAVGFEETMRQRRQEKAKNELEAELKRRGLNTGGGDGDAAADPQQAAAAAAAEERNKIRERLVEQERLKKVTEEIRENLGIGLKKDAEKSGMQTRNAIEAIGGSLTEGPQRQVKAINEQQLAIAKQQRDLQRELVNKIEAIAGIGVLT